MDEERGSLLSWQWTHYPSGHADRTNLLIHAITAPLFWSGLATLVLAPISGAPLGALGGLVLIVIAVAAQGRGHKREQVGPLPFRGPFDVVARLFVEQLVTFPRFVLSGGFARAWRRAGENVAIG
ncbi:terminase [Sandaracinus amylolyticus]|uniref:terminase n=1 Tax=Sandaracinus amylolyticus TaxID=927083 RepID=UPI001F166CB6|nr:terminase [Sandaracinus amylolyticus]UJR84938.1 Hypothetical protein I5071_70170 [Sandaracinus amylolyticus]